MPRLAACANALLHPIVPVALDHDPVVVAYGAGVDSTALLVGLYNSGRKVDLILFADTGSEKPETYCYLDIMDTWLVTHGMPTITRVKNRSPIAGDTSLHGECIRKSVLPSLAYGRHSCSLKWKVEPQWSFCRRHFGWQARQQRWAHGATICKMIGYNAGPKDAKRIRNATGKWPPGHRYEYPLVDWGWDRQRCENEIRAAGLPVPVKSACFMCPASKEAEVTWLQDNHPDLAAVALMMEERAHARGLRTVQGLGRRWAWTKFLRERAAQAERAA